MEAASREDVKCLQLLLEKGADVNHQDYVSSFHHEMRSLLLVHVPLYSMNGAYPVKFMYLLYVPPPSTPSEPKGSLLKAYIFVITITSMCLFTV